MQIGSNADKLSDLDNIDMIKSYFIITNIETLRSEAISDKLNRLCKDNTIGMCICDESHKVNNPQAQQTKGFLKIQPEYRLAMTGTPLMNRPTDLYVPLKWLGYESHAFYSFKKHYCKMGGFGGYEVIGYKNLDELQEKLNSIMLRRLKDNVLDLPEKTFIDEFVEMTPKQAQVYNEVSWDIKAHIDMIKKSNNPLAQLIRLRQATGYTGILSTSIKESAKIDRMIEIATEAIENGKKVVVFSNWTDVTLPAYNALATKFKGTYITGEIDSEQRQENVKKFQGDENCKFVVGSTSAMGTGITLTAGTVEIFLDEPWTSAVKSQAIDRCHRIGAKENVTIYTIMAKGTIDEKIHDIVEKKGVMSDAIVDNAYGKVTPEIIDYLLD
jgi:SNF2 family DNA or RNA helicase